MNQWKGGCINCGKFRWSEQDLSEGIDLASRNVHLIRENGQKTIVGMCEECFNLSKYDLDVIKQHLFESELECLQSRVKDKEMFEKRLKLVEGIKDLVFIDAVKP